MKIRIPTFWKFPKIKLSKGCTQSSAFIGIVLVIMTIVVGASTIAKVRASLNPDINTKLKRRR